MLDDLVFCCELELPLGSHGDLVEFPLARNGDSNLVTDSNKVHNIVMLAAGEQGEGGGGGVPKF